VVFCWVVNGVEVSTPRIRAMSAESSSPSVLTVGERRTNRDLHVLAQPSKSPCRPRALRRSTLPKTGSRTATELAASLDPSHVRRIKLSGWAQNSRAPAEAESSPSLQKVTRTPEVRDALDSADIGPLRAIELDACLESSVGLALTMLRSVASPVARR